MVNVGDENETIGEESNSPAQFCSSDPSPQSLSPSHFQESRIHFPFEQVNWFALHVTEK